MSHPTKTPFRAANGKTLRNGMNCELPQIVRTVQKRALVGNIECLAGEASRQRRLSCLYQDALMAVKVDIVVDHPGRALRLGQKEVDVGLDNGGESVRNTTGRGKVPDKRRGDSSRPVSPGKPEKGVTCRNDGICGGFFHPEDS
ncbi:MAG TPA: hypothetical protein H9680_09380 [Firmicutes bacterium]|nr:hypothetical protein [Bacillota bacterium]